LIRLGIEPMAVYRWLLLLKGDPTQLRLPRWLVPVQQESTDCS
jgi:hypothetical protein